MTANRTVIAARVAALALCVLALALGLPRSSVEGAPGATAATQAPAAALARWVELGPSGAAIARAVTERSTCPELTVDQRRLPMRPRAPSAAPDFPVLVCEAAIPTGAATAAIAGHSLPIPSPAPRRIVVIGDTGCRVAGDVAVIQDCNDPAAWPFGQVAESAAAWGPELVLHVGDYVYREMPCPPKHDGCAGSPWGDNWATWHTDFFAPAAPLLQAAPWVFVRGNHETCDREGRGWFRLLDPRPFAADCERYTEPYAIPLADRDLIVLDSAEAHDFAARADRVAIYAAQFEAVAALAGREAWLLTHRPLWAVGHAGEEAGVERLFHTNTVLQAASQDRLPPTVLLVLSGHLHLFEALSFADARPPQWVVGNGGTLLDPRIQSTLAGVEVGGTTISSGATLDRFGYLTIEPDASGWAATLRTVHGLPAASCMLESSPLTCAP